MPCGTATGSTRRLNFGLTFPQALEAYDRTAIVDQTHGGNPENEKTPLETAKLSLSSLGAWFDWKQSWEFDNNLVDYRHQAFMGRDGYVRKAYPGILFPFGHRCYLVAISERDQAPGCPRRVPVAALVHRDPPADEELPERPGRPVRAGHDRPTGDAGPRPAPEDQQPFVPTRNNVPFGFTLTTVDRGGETGPGPPHWSSSRRADGR